MRLWIKNPYTTRFSSNLSLSKAYSMPSLRHMMVRHIVLTGWSFVRIPNLNRHPLWRSHLLLIGDYFGKNPTKNKNPTSPMLNETSSHSHCLARPRGVLLQEQKWSVPKVINNIGSSRYECRTLSSLRITIAKESRQQLLRWQSNRCKSGFMDRFQPCCDLISTH